MTDTVNTIAPPDTDSTSVPTETEAAVLQRMIADLSRLSKDAQQRLINTVCTFLGLSGPAATGTMPANLSRPHAANRPSSFQFSEDDAPTVKQFIHDKAPQTDIERVACLAYYL